MCMPSALHETVVTPNIALLSEPKETPTRPLPLHLPWQVPPSSQPEDTGRVMLSKCSLLFPYASGSSGPFSNQPQRQARKVTGP